MLLFSQAVNEGFAAQLDEAELAQVDGNVESDDGNLGGVFTVRDDSQAGEPDLDVTNTPLRVGVADIQDDDDEDYSMHPLTQEMPSQHSQRVVHARNDVGNDEIDPEVPDRKRTKREVSQFFNGCHTFSFNQCKFNF